MFFKNVPMFAGLSAAEHAQLEQIAARRRVSRGLLIVQQGAPGERFYLLRKGRAKVYLGNDAGREVILALLGPGDCFAEMALVDSGPSSASVMTLEECELVSIGREEFQNLLRSSPDMAVNLLKALTARLRAADHQIASLALNDVRTRVEQVLRNLAEPENGTLMIPVRITHRDIAAMVGTSREVVTRAFRSLEASGLLRVEGRRIALAGCVAH